MMFTLLQSITAVGRMSSSVYYLILMSYYRTGSSIREEFEQAGAIECASRSSSITPNLNVEFANESTK